MVSSRAHYEGDRNKITKDGQNSWIPPTALNIIWGRDSRYWSLPDTDDKPAELLQVSWLEVSVSVDGIEPQKDYKVGFTVSLKADAFGWNKYPVYLMMKRSTDTEFSSVKVLFDGKAEGQQFEISGRLKKSEKPTTDKKIYFGLYEVWSGKWKGGLQIHNAFVREAAS